MAPTPRLTCGARRSRGLARSLLARFLATGLTVLALRASAGAQGHTELAVYANAQGELVIDGFSSGPAPVEESACLGGTCLYSGIDPGLLLEEDDAPGQGLVALAPGTHVYLTVDAADPEVRVRFNGANGTSFDLGPAPSHVHIEWMLQLPEGVYGSYDLSFHLTADGYTGSPSVSLQVSNLGEAPTPTPSPPPTPSPTPSPTPKPTSTPTRTPPPFVTPTPSPSPTPFRTPTPGVPPTSTPRPTPTSVGPTPVRTATPVATRTPRPTLTPVRTPAPTATPIGPTPPGGTPTPRPTASSAAAGVRPGRDGNSVLVNKDIGGERWAISKNADGTITGNVFFPDGRPPAFVFCEETGDDGENLQLACYGSDRCSAAPCPPEAWNFIADVELPLAFFNP